MASTIEQVKAGIWTLEEWKERFSKDEWATSEPDKYLVQLADRLFEGKDNEKVYFPCCGLSYDMKWAYDLGYEVVGTDCVAEGLKDFLENKAKVPYTEEKVEAVDGILYKSEDKKIRLYCCDVLKFSGSVEGQCGAIVDSASITSINKDDLPKYVEHLISMMTPNCRTVLFTTEYDENIYPGPPHSLPQPVIQSLFGDGFNYEQLTSYDMMDMDEFSECKESVDDQKEECKNQNNTSQDKDQAQTTGEKSLKAQKAEIFNQMMDLKSMFGYYTLITRKGCK